MLNTLHLHVINKLFMKGFDQMLLSLLVVVALLCLHQEDAA